MRILTLFVLNLFLFKKRIIFPCILSLFLTVSGSFAATSSYINYQGFLTSSGGVAQSGTASITVRIYDAPTGGSLLFEEQEEAVIITNGHFTIPIGSVGDVNGSTTASSITDLAFDKNYYVTVDIGAPFQTGEMTLEGGERSQMGIVPFAVSSSGVLTNSTSTGLAAAKGKMYFDTGSNKLYVYDGTSWSALSVEGAGISSLNGLTGISQFFAVSDSGSDIFITSTGTTHTLNIPDASLSARGVVSTGTQAFSGDKTFSGTTTVNGLVATALTASTLVSSTGTISNFSTTHSTSTSFFSDLLSGVSGFISSLTSGTITGGSITATSSLVTNGTLTATGISTFATSTASTLSVAGQTTLATASSSAFTSTVGYVSDLYLSGLFKDSAKASGASGQLLLSTGTSTLWVSTSSLGLAGVTAGVVGFGTRWLSPTTLGVSTFLDNGTVTGVNATSSTSNFNIKGTGTLNPFTVASVSGSPLLSVLSNGSVGIGVSAVSTSTKLAVVGGGFEIQAASTTGSLGSEMIVAAADRDFSSNTGKWTGTNWSVSGGTLNHALGAGNATLSNAALISNPVLGTYYQATFDITTITPGLVAVTFAGDSADATFGETAGTRSVQLVFYTSNTSSFKFLIFGDWTGSIDNVSIKKINSTSAAQTIKNSDGTVGLEIRAGGSNQGNSFVGVSSGLANTSGTDNAFFGLVAGRSNTTGSQNTFMGGASGYSNSIGDDNTFLGYSAGLVNTAGYANSFVGSHAGYANTFGYGNAFVGFQTGYSNTTGSNNAFFGTTSGVSNTEGVDNAFLGDAAGAGNTIGSNNAFVGSNTGQNIFNSSNNTIIGYYAGYGPLFTMSSSSNNTLLGYKSGFHMEDTIGNLFLGYQSGFNTTVGDYNILLGYNNDVASTTGSNQLNIGNLLYGTDLGINGNASIGNIGIGTSSPVARLSIAHRTGVDPFLITASSGVRYFGVSQTGDVSVGKSFSTSTSRLDVYKDTASSNVDVFRILTDVGSAENIKFKIDSDGDIFTDGGTTIGTPADLAENYPTNETLEAGTVVSFSSATEAWSLNNEETSTSTFQMSTVRPSLYGEEALGVISTRPGILLGGNTKNGVPVAFSGRVPVRVSNENGIIRRGDSLTTSSTTPGVAMKLTTSGYSIGRAISDADPQASLTTVLMVVENTHKDLSLSGVVGLEALEDITLSTSSASTVKERLTSILLSGGSIIKEYVALRMTAVAGYFDTLFAKEIYTNKVCLKKSNGTDVCLTGDQVQTMLDVSQTPPMTSSGDPTQLTSDETSAATDTQDTTATSTTETPVAEPISDAGGTSTDTSLELVSSEAADPISTEENSSSETPAP